MNGWLNDTQNFSMMEAECQKIIITWLIYQGTFVSFGDYFFRRLFHLVFTKNNHEIIKEISGHKWSTTHSAQISQTEDEWDLNPQPRAYRAHALTTEISGQTMRRDLFWSWIFQLSKMFQTKPNMTVLFLFPTLSKSSQSGSTCAGCSKFL